MKVPVEVKITFSNTLLNLEQSREIWESLEDWVFSRFGRSPSVIRRGEPVVKEWIVTILVKE